MRSVKSFGLFIFLIIAGSDTGAQFTDTELSQPTISANPDGTTLSKHSSENITHINSDKLNGHLEPETLQTLSVENYSEIVDNANALLHNENSDSFLNSDQQENGEGVTRNGLIYVSNTINHSTTSGDVSESTKPESASNSASNTSVNEEQIAGPFRKEDESSSEVYTEDDQLFTVTEEANDGKLFQMNDSEYDTFYGKDRGDTTTVSSISDNDPYKRILRILTREPNIPEQIDEEHTEAVTDNSEEEYFSGKDTDAKTELDENGNNSTTTIGSFSDKSYDKTNYNIDSTKPSEVINEENTPTYTMINYYTNGFMNTDILSSTTTIGTNFNKLPVFDDTTEKILTEDTASELAIENENASKQVAVSNHSDYIFSKNDYTEDFSNILGVTDEGILTSRFGETSGIGTTTNNYNEEDITDSEIYNTTEDTTKKVEEPEILLENSLRPTILVNTLRFNNKEQVSLVDNEYITVTSDSRNDDEIDTTTIPIRKLSDNSNIAEEFSNFKENAENLTNTVKPKESIGDKNEVNNTSRKGDIYSVNLTNMDFENNTTEVTDIYYISKNDETEENATETATNKIGTESFQITELIPKIEELITSPTKDSLPIVVYIDSATEDVVSTTISSVIESSVTNQIEKHYESENITVRGTESKYAVEQNNYDHRNSSQHFDTVSNEKTTDAIAFTGKESQNGLNNKENKSPSYKETSDSFTVIDNKNGSGNKDTGSILNKPTNSKYLDILSSEQITVQNNFTTTKSENSLENQNELLFHKPDSKNIVISNEGTNDQNNFAVIEKDNNTYAQTTSSLPDKNSNSQSFELISINNISGRNGFFKNENESTSGEETESVLNYESPTTNSVFTEYPSLKNLTTKTEEGDLSKNANIPETAAVARAISSLQDYLKNNINSILENFANTFSESDKTARKKFLINSNNSNTSTEAPIDIDKYSEPVYKNNDEHYSPPPDDDILTVNKDFILGNEYNSNSEDVKNPLNPYYEQSTFNSISTESAVTETITTYVYEDIRSTGKNIDLETSTMSMLTTSNENSSEYEEKLVNATTTQSNIFHDDYDKDDYSELDDHTEDELKKIMHQTENSKNTVTFDKTGENQNIDTEKIHNGKSEPKLKENVSNYSNIEDKSTPNYQKFSSKDGENLLENENDSGTTTAEYHENNIELVTEKTAKTINNSQPTINRTVVELKNQEDPATVYSLLEDLSHREDSIIMTKEDENKEFSGTKTIGSTVSTDDYGSTYNEENSYTGIDKNRTRVEDYEATTSMIPKMYNNEEDSIGSIEVKENATLKSVVNSVPYIKALGIGNNISIRVELEGASFYVPSDATVLEDVDKVTRNITWKSSDKFLNNSLSLTVKETPDIYLITDVQLNLVRGNKLKVWTRKEVTADMDYTEKTECEVEFGDDVRVFISNLSFLRRVENGEEIKSNVVESMASNIKIDGAYIGLAAGCTAAVLLICAILYVVISRSRKRTLVENLTKSDIPV